jgi:choline dehydrogenase-like flavoprotein
MVLLMQAEDAPQFTNRVDLDPEVRDLDGLPVPRITYQNHHFELSARDFYKPKMLDVIGAAGAKFGFIAPIDNPSASSHIMGTLRSGNDPKTSVCDRTGRFHDIGNLYAADGSIFPTSSGWNPTLTIATMAAYVGAQIVSPGAPARALAGKFGN